MSNIIDSIKLSGVTYTIQGSGGGGNPTVELTQAQYDALVTAGTVQADTYYIITDAQAGDLTNYYTKTEVDNAITAATATKQDTLVSGTNIKTINNQSILGSGNITIQGGGGGGKVIEAGRGISVTTGETADTVSFNLPISAGTGENSIVGNIAQNTASGKNALALGGFYNSPYSYCLSEASGLGSVSFGGKASGEQSFAAASMASTASGQRSATIAGYSNYSKGIESLTSGRFVNAENVWECSFGYSNVSHKANNTWGDSGNTLFSVGNGTSNNARHNAFEIRQNGDIYITSGGTDILLQDHLGGGNVPESRLNLLYGYGTSGGTDLFSWSTGSTSQVINKYVAFSKINNTSIICDENTSPTNFSLVETSAITTSVTSSSTDAQVPSAKAVNDKLGGLSLVKLSQSEYDSLSTYDSNTLYVIVN